MQRLEPSAAFSAALSALPAGLFEAPIGLAVSGGGDSLALLVLAHRWAAREGRALAVFTVDHGLRPEARAEAEAVAGLCRQLGLTHETLHLEGAPPRQASLRRGRHAALALAVRRKGGCLLLTGHTADDQAETFLMRARQGSGWYGLAGMRALSLSPVWPEGQGVFIARPLLEARRADLRGVLKRAGLAWADDPSNENPAFERVRMRALLCNGMQQTETVLRLVDRFQTLRMIEDATLWRWMKQNVTAPEGGLEVTSFGGLRPESAARALGLLIQMAAGKEAPPRGGSLERLLNRIVSEENFRGATLGGCRLRLRRGRLRLVAETGPPPPAMNVRRSALQAILSGNTQEIAAAAGKESFLEELVPIF